MMRTAGAEATLSAVHHRLELGSGHYLEIDEEGQLSRDGAPVTLRELTRRYPAHGRVWTWLRERGIHRVSTTSGPSGSDTRRRKARTISLSPEDNTRLEELASRLECSASAVVSRALAEFSRALGDPEK